MANKEENKKMTAEEAAAMAKETAQQTQSAAEETAACDNKAEDPTATEHDQEAQGSNPLDEANAKIAELKDKYIRTVAEFDNFKKRTLKEKAELILNGGEKTITAILPVLDDMERAVANADKAESIEMLEEGWELIFKKLYTILEGLGVSKIDTNDADFNVDYHEAIAMVPGMGDDKKGKVVDCVQTGYTLNDKVIRHAKVAIGQ